MDEDRLPAAKPVCLSVFHVMPRQMYFGAGRASSIDLCVRDLIAASRFRATTKVIAEDGGEPYPGFTVDRVPPAAYASTTARARHVAGVAARETPDVIIVQQHLPTAAALARALPGVKVVLQRHNFVKSPHSGNPLWDFVRNRIGQRRYVPLAGLIHVSEVCARAFAGDWPGVVVPSVVVTNGLDFSGWHPSPTREREILCVGRADPRKGILEAAEGLATVLPRFPLWRARFILSEIGSFPDYFRLVQAALVPLGAQAALETQVPYAEVKAAAERAAIALVPSTWAEPFGRTALEAHAGGAALITSGTGGLAEVSGDAALTLPEVTPAAIATAAETLIADEFLRERLARDGMTRARALFDIAAQAARLDSFCERLAAQSVPGGAAPFHNR